MEGATVTCTAAQTQALKDQVLATVSNGSRDATSCARHPMCRLEKGPLICLVAQTDRPFL